MAASTISLDATQLLAAHALYDSYAQQAARSVSEREELLHSMQAPAASTDPPVPELSAPLQVASISEQMGRVSRAHALHLEAYLHLIRGFVLHVLTPFQAGLLCAASHPYLIEFPAMMWQMLNVAGTPPSGSPIT